MRVFLSYRRDDSAHALWLYPWLIQWFGADRVFWDRKGIDPGEDFEAVITDQIRSSTAFIALVSDNWLSATDADGRRRIDSPDDWIRRETRLALDEGVLVIPVLVARAKAPSAQDLPPDLARFAKLQMLSMTDMSFYDRLRERLERSSPGVARAANHGTERTARLQRRAGNLLRRQVQRLQVRAAEMIDDGKLDRASEELTEGSELLMALLDLLPGDTTLDVQLGYLFGTTSQAFAAAGDKTQAARYRDLAKSIFQRVRDHPELQRERPQDIASAIKGLGGVCYESGDPVTAIEYYRLALEIDPRYCYAWHDLFLAYHMLATRGAVNLAGMREAIDKTRETGEARPGLGKDKLQKLEAMFSEWQRRVARDPDQEVNDGRKIRVIPRALVLVVTESDDGCAAFNFNFSLVHWIADKVNVKSMAANITTPKSRNVEFIWNVFYEIKQSGPPKAIVMSKTADARSIDLLAGRSDFGVQFVSSIPKSDLLWEQGKYVLDLSIMMSKDNEELCFDSTTKFSFQLSQYEDEQVKRWSRAPATDWDRLNDPDRAIGIPVIGLKAAV